MIFDKKLLIALMLYITALIASNTLGIKFMPFVFGTHLSTAIFVFPLVFIMTDVIGEVYGKKMAKTFVQIGFFSLLFFLIINVLSIIVPSAEDFTMKEAYNTIFGLSFRFTLASLVAFIIGEYQDVFSFFLIRKKTGEKHFWLRTNLSNLWGQLVDTVIWFAIAFVGVLPFGVIISLIIPWWLFKFGAGILYTPLAYIGLRLLKENENTSNQNKDI